jgi:hypothetical protein
MTNPTRIEVNCETGEVLEIELTDAEVLQREAEAEAHAAELAEREAEAADKAAAREAILDRLGLTADEAAILLG